MTNKETDSREAGGRTAFSGASEKFRGYFKKMNLEKLMAKALKIITPLSPISCVKERINDLREVGYDREARRGYIESERNRVLGIGAYVYGPMIASVDILLASDYIPRSFWPASEIGCNAAGLLTAMTILPLAAYSIKKGSVAGKILRETAKANRQYTLTGAPQEVPEYVGIDKVGDEALISRIAIKEMVCDVKEVLKAIMTKDKDEKLNGENE